MKDIITPYEELKQKYNEIKANNVNNLIADADTWLYFAFTEKENINNPFIFVKTITEQYDLTSKKAQEIAAALINANNDILKMFNK